MVVSGTDVRRPWGQVLDGQTGAPRWQPSAKVDYELELGFVMGAGNELGSPMPLATAAAGIFGYVLLNDWSARDVQAWEYVPLGPFTSKNWVRPSADGVVGWGRWMGPLGVVVGWGRWVCSLDGAEWQRGHKGQG